MPHEEKAIEVEVVEIDGLAPATPREKEHPGDAPPPQWQDWRQWQGRARRLDLRWWPLWLLLGIIALFLLLTVGLFVAVLLLILRLLRGLWTALTR